MTTAKGGEHKGAPCVLPGMVGKYTMADMSAWYAQALRILAAAGCQIVEPYGPDALSCVVVGVE